MGGPDPDGIMEFGGGHHPVEIGRCWFLLFRNVEKEEGFEYHKEDEEHTE